MEHFPLILVVIVVVAVAAFLKSKATYYGKIYSDEHYAEIGNWLCSCLKWGSATTSIGDGGYPLQSCARCGLTFTRHIEDTDTIHIAFSQIGNPTTHAVSSRVAFLILQILKQNKAEATFFYTESTVHHMVFSKEATGNWITNDINTAIANMQHHEHIRFQFQSSKES